jgi:hypothetical protein
MPNITIKISSLPQYKDYQLNEIIGVFPGDKITYHSNMSKTDFKRQILFNCTGNKKENHERTTTPHVDHSGVGPSGL